MLGPGGKIIWEYLKTHPVPGSTDVPGDGDLPVIDTPYGRLSNSICYDMDFTALIHQAGRKSTDIMLVPAWDWKAIDPLHANMASFRAIENGFSMVRQTGEGLSLAVDYHGRTLSAMDYFDSDSQVMVSNVPGTGLWTFYSEFGDIFAWICILIVLLRILPYTKKN